MGSPRLFIQNRCPSLELLVRAPCPWGAERIKGEEEGVSLELGKGLLRLYLFGNVSPPSLLRMADFHASSVLLPGVHMHHLKKGHFYQTISPSATAQCNHPKNRRDYLASVTAPLLLCLLAGRTDRLSVSLNGK